jgi:hypothetical protein
MAYLHGNSTKKVLFSWEMFTYGNISVALMIKIPLLLRNFIFHALATVTQPVLGKFPNKVKNSMTISNSVCILKCMGCFVNWGEAGNGGLAYIPGLNKATSEPQKFLSNFGFFHYLGQIVVVGARARTGEESCKNYMAPVLALTPTFWLILCSKKSKNGIKFLFFSLYRLIKELSQSQNRNRIRFRPAKIMWLRI